ncbi:pre-mRNA cleavage complex 2 protein Pcf11 [Geosmithia morbida]|uniref:Pre-mRNA cleavage complex 2 protein Pcf11 n=1 Tax=Geosmithia morbida TaxID=1094350 RepID=A0A9P5CZK2_9HYPO|nr:pre-mRNA cleavage complex 2 protein Pcf11 [Geosmithia morbida]KAF4121668.1 pre-mRNA cleavage complex 2 protein Pcf11 [Geosmithia morbida]
MSNEAEEVAEDYRQALEDLSQNTRFEISNLTVIARENTNHALAIAEVLEKHIIKVSTPLRSEQVLKDGQLCCLKAGSPLSNAFATYCLRVRVLVWKDLMADSYPQTAPAKKLPALYVLDSIVKNVGTPYTLYLGRNLFKIFMEAYTVVDNPTRKRMEEMLKTWKLPVAGALDTRPVFSPELVRPIENALMKAKAAMMPQTQIPGRPRSAMTPHRNSPTPPGAMRATPGLTPQSHPHPYGMPSADPASAQMMYPGQGQPYSQQPTPVPAGVPHQQPGYGTGALPGGVHVETLSSDIHNLIVAMRAEASQNPHDTGAQTRLRALLDLQPIVQSGRVAPEQLALIENQVTELAAVTLRSSSHRPNPAPPQHQQPSAYPILPREHQPAAPVAPASQPSGQAPLTLDSLLGAGALATLMARQSSQRSTPNPPPAVAAPPAAAPYVAPAPAPAPEPSGGGASSLLDQLRMVGLLPSTPTPANVVAAPAVAPAPPAIPANIANILSAQRAMAAMGTPIRGGLDTASLRQPAPPKIVSSLYEQLGPPCSQCGRRFKTDEEGRKKKMAHMDWHFRVHQRGAEADKRGSHRSWYVDAQDWLQSREVVDSDHLAAQEDRAAEASKAAAEAAKPKYMAVPEPTSGVNNVCPICQDKFENKWLDTAQEWVWLDAVLVGGRAYHASCHDEATRDREGTPRLSSDTSATVLGKRKAEGGLASPKVRSLKSFG